MCGEFNGTPTQENESEDRMFIEFDSTTGSVITHPVKPKSTLVRPPPTSVPGPGIAWPPAYTDARSSRLGTFLVGAACGALTVMATLAALGVFS